MIITNFIIKGKFMRLSEDTKEMIQGLASQIDWEKVAKGPDKDKVVQAFADKIAASCDNSEKEEAEELQKALDNFKKAIEKSMEE